MKNRTEDRCFSNLSKSYFQQPELKLKSSNSEKKGFLSQRSNIQRPFTAQSNVSKDKQRQFENTLTTSHSYFNNNSGVNFY